jgi:serine phosphatase RsbU (regulator of sigma subunit)/uncharacterized protein YigA (DUF484 family)
MAAPPTSARSVDAAPDGAEALLLDGLAEAARTLVSGASSARALRIVARAAADALGAPLVVVRTCQPGGEQLVTAALHARSDALAAEVEGSRLHVAELAGGETDLAASDPRVPAAVRRTAARAGAARALVVPVAGEDGLVATLEIYRSGTPCTSSERALARLAAAHVELALELDAALGGADLPARIRLALEVAGEALAAGSDETELADHLVRLAAETTGATGAVLWRVEDGDPPAALAQHGEPGRAEADAESVRRFLEERAAGNGSARRGRPLLVPLGEPPAGALALSFATEPDPAALEALSGLAARAGVALRRTRRARQVAGALERSQTVVAVVSQAIAQLSLAHTLETAVERVSELTASEDVGLYLREGERLVAASVRGRAGDTALAERLLELALGPFRSRGFLLLADLARDARLAGLEDVLAETGLRRGLVVPLVVQDEVIGALAVFERGPREYEPGEEGLLIALSSQLAVAVQNARLHERTKELGAVLERTLASERKAARQLRGLFEISHSFTRSLSLDATLEAVAATMVELFDLDLATIRLPDTRRGEAVLHALSVADPSLEGPATTMFSRPVPLDDPLVARVLGERHAVLLAAGAEDALPHSVLEPFLGKGSTAAMLPLATPGEVLGTLTLVSLDPARPIDQETLEAAATVTAQAALAIDNARLYQQQKDFSETMQRSLLPREFPKVPRLEIGHVYQSASRVDVGGDVYDLLALDDGRIAVCLGDVVGKGIEAAADMAMAKFAFRSLARLYPEPGTFLAHANDVVVEEIAPGKFLTMLYVLVDPETGELACANAGHPPFRLVRPDGSVQALPSPGLALGIDPGQEYPEERIAVPPGSSAVLFTDGVIECRSNGELYGEGRLDAFLAANARLGAQELADALLADCRTFAGGELGDDCAIVCLQVTG